MIKSPKKRKHQAILFTSVFFLSFILMTSLGQADLNKDLVHGYEANFAPGLYTLGNWVISVLESVFFTF